MSEQNMKYKVQVNFYHKSFPLPGVLSVPGVPELVVLLLYWGGAAKVLAELWQCCQCWWCGGRVNNRAAPGA